MATAPITSSSLDIPREKPIDEINNFSRSWYMLFDSMIRVIKSQSSKLDALEADIAAIHVTLGDTEG